MRPHSLVSGREDGEWGASDCPIHSAHAWGKHPTLCWPNLGLLHEKLRQWLNVIAMESATPRATCNRMHEGQGLGFVVEGPCGLAFCICLAPPLIIFTVWSADI
jgi:hypothetical protein